MKTALTSLLLFLYFYSHSTEKFVIANIGQGWSNGSNFYPAGVPQNNDVVTIPLGLTISIKGGIYGAGRPHLKILVYGTLDFDPSGKLDIGSLSVVQLYTLGKITTNGTSSELITMGGVVKYNGQNDGIVLGPKYASAATATSGTAIDYGGFVFGVLPIKLHDFSLNNHQGEVSLNWSVSADSNGDLYTLQRMTGNDWTDLKTFQPPGSSASTEVSYNYTDKTPVAGQEFIQA